MFFSRCIEPIFLFIYFFCKFEIQTLYTRLLTKTIFALVRLSRQKKKKLNSFTKIRDRTKVTDYVPKNNISAVRKSFYDRIVMAVEPKKKKKKNGILPRLEMVYCGIRSTVTWCGKRGGKKKLKKDIRALTVTAVYFIYGIFYLRYTWSCWSALHTFFKISVINPMS